MMARLLFLLSILLSASSASAMYNGVRVVDSKSFDVVLAAGTQEAITTWRDNNKVDLNARCIKVENFPSTGVTRYRYPLEHLMMRYGRSPTLFAPLLTILIAQGVPVDGYDDFSTLCQAICGNDSPEIVAILYGLGADPIKKFVRDGITQTSIEYVQNFIKEEKKIKRVNDWSRIRKYENMLNIFANPLKPIAHSPHGATQPTVVNNVQQAVRGNQTLNNNAPRLVLFTVPQVIGIAIGGVLAGVILKKVYDQYVSDTWQDSVDSPQELSGEHT